MSPTPCKLMWPVYTAASHHARPGAIRGGVFAGCRQLSPCGHPRLRIKSSPPSSESYRGLAENYSRYCRLPLYTDSKLRPRVSANGDFTVIIMQSLWKLIAAPKSNLSREHRPSITPRQRTHQAWAVCGFLPGTIYHIHLKSRVPSPAVSGTRSLPLFHGVPSLGLADDVCWCFP